MPASVERALLRIPPLSHAAARLHLMNDEMADLRELAALISSDPALSGLVLRLVNSPLFGVRQRVTGILQAVALVGLDRLRVLATTAALRILIGSTSASAALTRCWQHSVACALIAQDLAARVGFDEDATYTAALLHDIGCFAMLSCWPKEYSQLLATCSPAQLLAREFESVGVSHPDAGAYLLQNWGLPSELVAAARHHHNGGKGRQSALVELVSCSCTMADSFGFALTAQAPDDPAGNTLRPPHLEQEPLWLRIADGINQLDCL